MSLCCTVGYKRVTVDVMDFIKFEFNDMISLYTKYDSEWWWFVSLDFRFWTMNVLILQWCVCFFYLFFLVSVITVWGSKLHRFFQQYLVQWESESSCAFGRSNFEILNSFKNAGKNKRKIKEKREFLRKISFWQSRENLI